MMSFDAGTVKHPTRETALAPRDDAGIRVGWAGASDEVIRRRLLVPRPYYTITVQRVDRPSAEHHHPSASRVARSILRSVKMSRSSRLRVENSETTAPSSPA